MAQRFVGAITGGAPGHITEGRAQPLVDLACVIFDFDKTITEEDTIELVVHTAIDSNGSPQKRRELLDSWNLLVQSYTNQHEALLEEMKSVRRDEEEASSGGPGLNPLKSLERVFKREELLEYESVRTVERRMFLAGMKQESWRELGRKKEVKLKEGSLSLIEELKSLHIPVYILSSNWCKDFVFGCLEGRVDEDNIIANQPIYDPTSHLSTGAVQFSVVSAFDKQKHVEQLRSKQQKEKKDKENNEPNGNKIAEAAVMYVGDSTNDLMALLEADLGVLLGSNQNVLRIMENNHIRMLPLRDCVKDPKSLSATGKCFKKQQTTRRNNHNINKQTNKQISLVMSQIGMTYGLPCLAARHQDMCLPIPCKYSQVTTDHICGKMRRNEW